MRYLILLLCALTLFGQLARADEPVPSLELYVKQALARSTFVFRGEVVRVNAASFAAVPVSHRTAVVRVKHVYRAPNNFPNYLEREITVFLAAGEPVTAGETLDFFSKGWLAGDGIAVEETGRLKGMSTTRVDQLLLRASLQVRLEDLRERLTLAGLAVEAEVGQATRLDPKEQEFSEHDPQWMRAPLKITRVFKGKTPRPPVFLFPASVDVMWTDVPKPKEGERLVLFLNWDAELKHYIIDSPRDVLPAAATREIVAAQKLPAKPLGEDQTGGKPR
jgi:hypothetical protein